ncbi:hypothetical protein pb186bvf_002854 [Paramecium bursaria]
MIHYYIISKIPLQQQGFSQFMISLRHKQIQVILNKDVLMGAFQSCKSLNQSKPKKQFSALDDYPKPIDSDHDLPKATNNSTKIKGTVWIRKFKFPEDDNLHPFDEVKTQQNKLDKDRFQSEGSFRSLNDNQLQQMRSHSGLNNSDSGLNNSDSDWLRIPTQQKGILKKYRSQSSSRSTSSKRVIFNLKAMKIHSIERNNKPKKKQKGITMQELLTLFIDLPNIFISCYDISLLIYKPYSLFRKKLKFIKLNYIILFFQQFQASQYGQVQSSQNQEFLK